MIRLFLLLLLFVVASPRLVAADAKPNILLIVADDLGYSDLGCYGGEIETPALDGLAREGVRFSEFHVNPMCVVTRTSLLTGHTYSQSDHFRRSLPIAHLMRKAGYATSIVGKWHQPGNPLDAGFDSFHGFLGGAINSWTGQAGGRDQIQTDRGRPQPVPDDWYASDAFTDVAIQQIDAAVAQDRPFFSYVAFNAPHSPLHAPRESVVKYYERYRQGWDKLRHERFTRLRKLGLIDDRYLMTEPEAEVRRWNELPAEVRELESKRVAAYAGMVDRMDWNIGRLLKHLRERGLDDNTMVIFLSDNGGDYGNGDIKTYAQQIPWKRETSPFASTGWAYLKCTPFRWYKSSAQEGGVSVPLIVRWPDRLASQPGGILKQRLHVTDLYPTFLELAGQEYPERDGDRKLEPLYGSSMLPLFRDPSLPQYAIHNEMFWAFNYTGKGMAKGDWKVSSISDGPWKLYNIANDPAEANNLAAAHPERVKTMGDAWFRFAKERTTMPPDWRMPLADHQQGWGYHRLKMVMPAYEQATPAASAVDVPLNTDLSFTFSKPISFNNSVGRTIRLYQADAPNKVVWQSDPEPGHPSEGSRTIRFENLPKLKPDTTYFALADAGWIKIGGKPAGPLNDGAYWYRFRTAATSDKQ